MHSIQLTRAKAQCSKCSKAFEFSLFGNFSLFLEYLLYLSYIVESWNVVCASRSSTRTKFWYVLILNEIYTVAGFPPLSLSAADWIVTSYVHIRLIQCECVLTWSKLIWHFVYLCHHTMQIPFTFTQKARILTNNNIVPMLTDMD